MSSFLMTRRSRPSWRRRDPPASGCRSAPRSMEESPAHAAEEPATPDGDVPHDGESVDGIAGSEFVDDRIRLRE